MKLFTTEAEFEAKKDDRIMAIKKQTWNSNTRSNNKKKKPNTCVKL